MRLRNLILASLVLLFDCVWPADGWARSVNVPLVRIGEPVTAEIAERQGWSGPVLALAKHRLRSMIWVHSVNRQPGQTFIGFDGTTTADAQELIDAFAALGGTVVLSARDKPGVDGQTHFSVAEDALGTCFIAQEKLPPVLKLYVGKEDVKVDKLRIPVTLKVVGADLDDAPDDLAAKIRKLAEAQE